MSSPNDANRRHQEDEASARFQDRHPHYFARLEEGTRPRTGLHGTSRLAQSPLHHNDRYPHDRLGTDHGVSRSAAVRARASNDRYRLTAHHRSRSGPRELQRAVSQLDAASSNLRALLDDPIPAMSAPNLLSLSAGNDSASEAEPSRRFKRRKLDTDKQPADYKGFSYGYYGQVVPGQLRMEIVSCDGGSFESDSNRHAAENVLRDDRSVYCTKANRCNLILRHQGATPFCLDELVIKAPPRGYTAPVQEGMIFVSMTSDDLLARTARYQIQYSSPKRSGRRSSEDPENEPPPIVSIRHNGDGTVSTSHHSRIGRDPEGRDRRAQIPSEFAVLNSSNFTVTTEKTDDEDEEEDDEYSSPYRRRDSSHLEPFSFEESTDLEDGQESPWYLRAEPHLRRPAHRESPRRETPSQITLAEAIESSQIATQEAVKAVGGEFMAAHARFFIEKNKSRCTIKFDPPISGRFILLKMWSPRRETNKNIDIQSVIARGYAGPRIFPSQQYL